MLYRSLHDIGRISRLVDKLCLFRYISGCTRASVCSILSSAYLHHPSVELLGLLRVLSVPTVHHISRRVLFRVLHYLELAKASAVSAALSIPPPTVFSSKDDWFSYVVDTECVLVAPVRTILRDMCVSLVNVSQPRRVITVWGTASTVVFFDELSHELHNVGYFISPSVLMELFCYVGGVTLFGC